MCFYQKKAKRYIKIKFRNSLQKVSISLFEKQELLNIYEIEIIQNTLYIIPLHEIIQDVLVDEMSSIVTLKLYIETIYFRIVKLMCCAKRNQKIINAFFAELQRDKNLSSYATL